MTDGTCPSSKVQSILTCITPFQSTSPVSNHLNGAVQADILCPGTISYNASSCAAGSELYNIMSIPFQFNTPYTIAPVQNFSPTGFPLQGVKILFLRAQDGGIQAVTPETSSWNAWTVTLNSDGSFASAAPVAGNTATGASRFGIAFYPFFPSGIPSRPVAVNSSNCTTLAPTVLLMYAPGIGEAGYGMRFVVDTSKGTLHNMEGDDTGIQQLNICETTGCITNDASAPDAKSKFGVILVSAPSEPNLGDCLSMVRSPLCQPFFSHQGTCPVFTIPDRFVGCVQDPKVKQAAKEYFSTACNILSANSEDCIYGAPCTQFNANTRNGAMCRALGYASYQNVVGSTSTASEVAASAMISASDTTALLHTLCDDMDGNPVARVLQDRPDCACINFRQSAFEDTTLGLSYNDMVTIMQKGGQLPLASASCWWPACTSPGNADVGVLVPPDLRQGGSEYVAKIIQECGDTMTCIAAVGNVDVTDDSQVKLVLKNSCGDQLLQPSAPPATPATSSHHAGSGSSAGSNSGTGSSSAGSSSGSMSLSSGFVAEGSSFFALRHKYATYYAVPDWSWIAPLAIVIGVAVIVAIICGVVFSRSARKKQYQKGVQAGQVKAAKELNSTFPTLEQNMSIR